MPHLKRLEVAILATNGFDQVELTEPRKPPDEVVAKSSMVSPETAQVRESKSRDGGDTFRVDMQLDQASPEEFDARSCFPEAS